MFIFRPFRTAGFTVLWSGLALSIIGDQLFAVVFSWIAIQAFGAAAGYLAALNPLILFLAALFVGRWADTHDQRHCMIAADLYRAVVLMFVVVCWSYTGEISAWLLIIALIGLGTGEAIFRPALQSVVPDLVHDTNLLPAANGLLDATGRAARLAGPAMIVPLSLILPARHFLSFDAATFLLSAGAVMMIGRSIKSVRHTPASRSIIASAIRGFQATRHHPVLNYTLITYGLLNAAWNTAYYLALPMLLMAHGIKGPGNSGIGALALIIAVYGGSNLISTFIFGNRQLSNRPQLQIFGGSLVIGGGLVLLAAIEFVPHDWQLPCYLVIAAATAIGGPMKDIPFAVLRQTCLAKDDVPAAMRAYLLVHSSGMLVGWLLMPTAIAFLGPVGVIVICGVATIGVGLGGFALYTEWVGPKPHPI
jgi:MFS family permease